MKKKTKYHMVVFLFFNSVYIQQSLEITDAQKKKKKIKRKQKTLMESAIDSYFLVGQQLKIQRIK